MLAKDTAEMGVGAKSGGERDIQQGRRCVCTGEQMARSGKAAVRDVALIGDAEMLVKSAAQVFSAHA